MTKIIKVSLILLLSLLGILVIYISFQKNSNKDIEKKSITSENTTANTNQENPLAFIAVQNSEISNSFVEIYNKYDTYLTSELTDYSKEHPFIDQFSQAFKNQSNTNSIMLIARRYSDENNAKIVNQQTISDIIQSSNKNRIISKIPLENYIAGTDIYLSEKKLTPTITQFDYIFAIQMKTLTIMLNYTTLQNNLKNNNLENQTFFTDLINKMLNRINNNHSQNQ